MKFYDFKDQVKAVYNGNVKWDLDGYNFYACIPGRKIRFHRESQNWTVEIYFNRVYQSTGFGDDLIESEAHAQRNWAINKRAKQVRHQQELIRKAKNQNTKEDNQPCNITILATTQSSPLT